LENRHNRGMDRSLRKFKTRNAPFFGEYTNARMIIDLGSQGNPPPTPPAPRNRNLKFDWA
jgi:hypothetical protein